MACYGLTLSHNENRKGPSVILGVGKKLMRRAGGKATTLSQVSLTRLFFPQGSSPSLDSQPDSGKRQVQPLSIARASAINSSSDTEVVQRPDSQYF